MRTFVTIISLVLSFPFYIISTSTGAEPDKALYNKCLYPTIRVHNAGEHIGGSGIITRSEKVGDEYHNVAISCSHVTKEYMDNVEIDFFIYDNYSAIAKMMTYKCKVYYAHDDKDLAILLFTSDQKLPTVTLGMEEKLYIGTDVFKVGCGLGDEPQLEYGKVTSIHVKNDIAKGMQLYRTNVMTIFGDSGGPVFHKNKLVGISQAVRIKNNIPYFKVSFIIPINRIKLMDEEANNNLGFIYKPSKKMPTLPYSILRLEGFEIIKG